MLCLGPKKSLTSPRHECTRAQHTNVQKSSVKTTQLSRHPKFKCKLVSNKVFYYLGTTYWLESNKMLVSHKRITVSNSPPLHKYLNDRFFPHRSDFHECQFASFQAIHHKHSVPTCLHHNDLQWSIINMENCHNEGLIL